MCIQTLSYKTLTIDIVKKSLAKMAITFAHESSQTYIEYIASLSPHYFIMFILGQTSISNIQGQTSISIVN